MRKRTVVYVLEARNRLTGERRLIGGYPRYVSAVQVAGGSLLPRRDGWHHHVERMSFRDRSQR